LVGPCSSNPLGCSCSFSSQGLCYPAPLGRLLLFSSYRSLFFQPSELFLFFTLPWTVPVTPLSLGDPCSFSSFGSPLFLHPWVVPVLSPALEGPCYSTPLGRPLFFLLPWKAPGLSPALEGPAPTPSIPFGCLSFFSPPGRLLLLLLSGMHLFFLLHWKVPVTPLPLGSPCSFSLLFSLLPYKAPTLQPHWDASILSPPLEGPCYSTPAGRPLFFFFGRPLLLHPSSWVVLILSPPL
jgi:hypothetical protein